MGEPTLYGNFYKPALGASGVVEKGKFDDALDLADAQIKANENPSNIVKCSDYNNPDDAITAIGASNKTLLVTEAETCDNNFTVPANVTVKFERGGKWTINNGVTVTFNGQIDAGLWQIFAYTGTGMLINLTQEVFTTWWGGNIGVQINSAVAALTSNRGTITIPSGSYSFDTPIILDDHIILQGMSRNVTLAWTGTDDTKDVITTNGNYLTLQNFAVSVQTGKSARSIIYIQNTRTSYFINLKLNGDQTDNTTTLNGIYADGNTDNNVYYNHFENVYVGYCNEGWHLSGTAVTQNTFINCRASSSTLYGFYGTGNRFTMIGCLFEMNAGIALKTTYGEVACFGCYFEGNGGTDIDIDHPHNVVIQGCRFKNSATKDYIIYCASTSGEYTGTQIKDNMFFQKTGTVTTAIYLSASANADGNIFSVLSGAITNEYYRPLGSRVDGTPLIFPATQVPSTNVNALDDYKEGEWTPTLKFGGASVDMTYTTQAGLYTKIGRQVTVTGRITLSAKGSSIGNAKLEGLPFTCKNSDSAYSPVSLALWNITFANVFMGYVSKNTTTMSLQEVIEDGTSTNLDNGDFTDTSTIIFGVTYFTD